MGLTFRHPTGSDRDVAGFMALQDAYEPRFQAGDGDGRAAEVRRRLIKHRKILMIADFDGQIVGSACAFSLSVVDIEMVKRGDLPESALIPNADGDACYISGINILPKYRTNRLVLLGLMAHLAEEIGKRSPTMVYAQPATPEGLAIMSKFGFTASHGQRMDDPIYEANVLSSNAIRFAVGRYYRKISLKFADGGLIAA